MLNRDKIIPFVREALKEDIGKIDLTTTFLISSQVCIKADIVAKSEGVLAGLPLVEVVYSLIDRDLRIRFNAKEGGHLEKGKAVCFIEGRARSILMGERVALNFLSHASGIATVTKRYVDKVAPYNVDVYDTRKTLPNLRYLEKYAVRIGGGKNHRMGLYDQVLIKDNHLAVLRGLRKSTGQTVICDAIKTAKKRAQKNVSVEVEVRSIAEFEQALAASVDIIMLDNMSPELVGEAVKIRDAAGSRGRRIVLEASGNITLDNIRQYAETGVDRISVGALTHSPSIVDFSLETL